MIFCPNHCSVSRLLLIEDLNVRQYLEEAENMINRGEYLEALIQIKKAFYVGQPSERTFINKDDFFTGFFLTSGFRNMPELKKPIEKIVDKINEMEKNMSLLMMGIGVLKLRRFEEITPHFYFVMGEYSLIIHWNNKCSSIHDLKQLDVGAWFGRQRTRLNSFPRQDKKGDRLCSSIA
jgi:hypothetical protein